MYTYIDRNERKRKLVAQGYCKQCMKPRGEDGTKSMCRPCADAQQEAGRKHREKLRDEGICRECGKKVGKKKFVTRGMCFTCSIRASTRGLFNGAKNRARKRNIPFDLTRKDIIVPDKCPVLGIPLRFNLGGKSSSDNSPTIDRFDPEKGYTKNNINIISMKANRIKDRATIEDVKRVLSWMKKQQRQKQFKKFIFWE